MKRNRDRDRVRRAAIATAAAATGVTIWSSTASAAWDFSSGPASTERRPAEFETEFELDVEVAAEGLTAAQPIAEAHDWICECPQELIASEATMDGWARAINDYLDQFLDEAADDEPRTAEAALVHDTTDPTACEICGVLGRWSEVPRAEAIQASADSGDVCFRLPVGEERQASVD
jgi:hypothetical protein